MIHDIPLERRTLHGHFSRELEPILSIDPGESIAFACPNAGWELDPGERFEPYDEELDAGHALIGPIEVRGAKAGQTLVVHVDEVRPGSWGVTYGHDVKVDWLWSRFSAVIVAPFSGRPASSVTVPATRPICARASTAIASSNTAVTATVRFIAQSIIQRSRYSVETACISSLNRCLQPRFLRAV